jgi:hypothetical protein
MFDYLSYFEKIKIIIYFVIICFITKEYYIFQHIF